MNSRFLKSFRYKRFKKIVFLLEPLYLKMLRTHAEHCLLYKIFLLSIYHIQVFQVFKITKKNSYEYLFKTQLYIYTQIIKCTNK